MSSEVLFDYLLNNPSSFEAFVGSMCAMVALGFACICIVAVTVCYCISTKRGKKEDNKDKEDK